MAPISRKRKEREGFFTHPIKSQVQHPNTTSSWKPKPMTEPAPSNRLLAGFLAHEFLTQGTLLGHKPDPGPSRVGSDEEPKGYGEVARLMKTDGAHLPGIVNPTQLARWIQM